MGTIGIPDPLPSPIDDSEKLRKAVQGWGTDENAIIEVLGHRNASQRMKICQTYQDIYKESLIDRLHSELSGDFRNAVKLWTWDPPPRDARLANEAINRHDLVTIIEIACASCPQHLMAVRQAYCSIFKRSLEEDIALRVTQLPIKKLLVGLVSSYRYDRNRMEETVARSEAAKLHNAIENKTLVDDEVLRILSTRNKSQLKLTFSLYKQDYGNPIDQDIKSCGNDKLGTLLQRTVWCIDSPEKHFAEVARTSIVGFGTDEDSLTRVIVTRAEIDMKKIMEEYYNMYQSGLVDDVVGDTSGYYKAFLLALLGQGNL
eukprot:TRINITY_DN25653_c0_g1_i1.p1 TRINITY_DN25653_c0_g1~~TRINITY_DN25653_c0_g1_i1.p1  ORF type:complete len:316 (-),score=49.16 TRINITY_DN25653_c0_g1_i1:170-1117(-)